MNSDKIKALIAQNRALFWSIPENARNDISLNILVETILQYGDIPDIQRLFKLIGIKEVAEIFNQQVHRPRCNYHPRTINYFKLYFSRYAS